MASDEREHKPRPRHRFRFGERWEIRRQKRSTRRIWKFVLVDLALLAAIVILIQLLVDQLS